jgi:hypothetical protein
VGNWSNGGAWGTGLPGSSSDVSINTGSDNVTLDTNSSINSLTLGGTTGSSQLVGDSYGHSVTIAGALTINQSGSLQLNGDTFTVGASSSNSGDLELNGGFDGVHSTLTINGDLTNSGTVGMLDQGPGNSLNITGTLTNSRNGSLLLGTIDTGFGTGVVNIGRLINNGDANINVTLNLTNQPGGFTDIVAGSSFTVGIYGTFTASGNDPFANLTSVEGSLVLAGQGANVNPVGGTLTNTGEISLSNNVHMQVNGNVNNSGGMGTGYPYTDPVSGGTFSISGTLTNSGGIGLSLGILSVGQGMTNSGTVSVNGGTLTVNGDLSNSGEISLAQTPDYTEYCGCNTLTVRGNLVNSGQVTTDFGLNTVTISGKLTNNAGATFSLGGIGAFSGEVGNIAHITNAGTVSIASGAALNVGGASAPTNALPGFVNTGIVNIVHGGTVTSGLTYVQTAGQTTVDGTLRVFGRFANVNFAGGSVYGNQGTIQGPITSNAAINIGDSPMTVGELSFVGNYTQGANGSLTFDIGGTSPGQYDQLNVSGRAQLNGLMTVDLLHGFVPQIGNSFDIMNFASESGTFSMVVGLPINGQEHFVLDYNLTNLTLDVVPGQLSGLDTRGDSASLFANEPFMTQTDGNGYLLAAANNGGASPTPEPSSILLLGTGIVGLAVLLRRKR